MVMHRGIHIGIVTMVTCNVLASCLVALALASPSFVTTRPSVLRFLAVAIASCIAGCLSPFFPTKILSFFSLLFCLWGARIGWKLNGYGVTEVAGNPAYNLVQVGIAVVGVLYWALERTEGRTQVKK
jgi:hypothetical protein